jgi:hypothetical protein
MGYSILLLDNRGCASPYKYVTFGYLESKDINTWCNYMYKEYKKDIILGGVSLGASSVLMTNNKHVKAIISDSAYADAYKEVSYAINHYFHVPSILFMWLINIYTKVFIGQYLKDINVYNNLNNINIPILLIHGNADDFVPTNNVYKIYDYYNGEKKILTIDNAMHGMSYLVNKEKYVSTIKDFLSQIK